MATPKVLNIFSEVPNPVSPAGQKPAKQEFKSDCDINSIMRKFQKTGAIDHAATYGADYGIASPQDLHAALNVVTRAQSMFNALPSTVRSRFEHNAEKFLEFVQDESNAEEAHSLGISLAPEAAQAANERIAREAEEAAASPEPAPEPAPAAAEPT